MTIKDLLDRIDQLDDERTIYAAEPWTERSEAVASIEPENGSLPSEATGMRYLLEASLARDVINVWRQWRGGAEPTSSQRCEAVIHYARNDSYLPA